MRDVELCPTFEVSNGAGNFEDSGRGRGSEALLLHGALEKFLGIGSEFAEGPNLASAPLRALE
jgi:hypothetical protein